MSCLGRLDVVARGEPVVCCGREIAPGDVLVGDGDGVVVVPARAVGRVTDGVAALRDLDEWLDEATAAGRTPRELYCEIARRLTGLRASGS
jgi:regulator of RNase E activity RraA